MRLPKYMEPLSCGCRARCSDDCMCQTPGCDLRGGCDNTADGIYKPTGEFACLNCAHEIESRATCPVCKDNSAVCGHWAEAS